MPTQGFHVRVDWDEEAPIWVSTSENIPGLATEASTIEALMTRLEVMVPELLELNSADLGEGKVSLNRQAYREASGRQCPAYTRLGRERL